MNTTSQNSHFPAESTRSINPTKLDTLASEFQTWRDSKKSRSEKMPDDLLNKAKALMGEFKPATIHKRLKVSGAQLNPNKPKSTTTAQHNKKQTVPQDQFIQLPDPIEPQVHPVNTELRVDIVTRQGVRISVSGLAKQSPAALLSQLLGDAPC